MAHRFRVSLGMVKKLLQQRRRTGDIAPRHHLAGRKPMIVAVHRSRLRALLAKKSGLTLKELRAAMELKCSLQAIHVVLARMGLTYKKRHSGPASRTGRTLPEPARRGGGGSAASTRRD
jgi:transposase